MGKLLNLRRIMKKNGLLVWGGREPRQDMSLKELKERTESIGVYPVGANVAYIFPFKQE